MYNTCTIHIRAYINNIYTGNNIYGVRACWRFLAERKMRSFSPSLPLSPPGNDPTFCGPCNTADFNGIS